MVVKVGVHLPGKLYWFRLSVAGICISITAGLPAYITYTFTFRAFSRCFCPKRLTISAFVTLEKPQHITIDKVKKKKIETFFKP